MLPCGEAVLFRPSRQDLTPHLGPVDKKVGTGGDGAHELDRLTQLHHHQTLSFGTVDLRGS